MNWYKIPQGLPLDPKLAVIAKRTGLRRSEVLALWIALLDQASGSQPRGIAGGADAEEIAASLELEASAVESAIAAFQDKGLILPGGAVAGWDKNQKFSTPRTRAYRAKPPLPKLPPPQPVETDETRRRRLQGEILERHRSRGRIITEHF